MGRSIECILDHDRRENVMSCPPCSSEMKRIYEEFKIGQWHLIVLISPDSDQLQWVLPKECTKEADIVGQGLMLLQSDLHSLVQLKRKLQALEQKKALKKKTGKATNEIIQTLTCFIDFIRQHPDVLHFSFEEM